MIKKITEEEFTPFLPLMAEVECGSHFDFENPRHRDWLKKRISIHFYRGAYFFGCFSENGPPLGFSALLIEERPEGSASQGQKCELLDIGIFKEHRNQGIGSKLLGHTEEFAKNAGIYCMFMSTYAKDYQVISFYGKNGYVPVATLPDVHGPNDEGIVFMRKILQK